MTEYDAPIEQPAEAAAWRGPERQPESPLRVVHRCLRGRYGWALLLGAALSIPGAVAGYLAAWPRYESTGLVRVAPTLPKILYESDENELPPLFESFVAAQASFLKTRRVLDRAAESPALREVGWPSGADGIALLEERLSVTTRPKTELIVVSVSHDEPVMAQRAVNAVLDAYQELYGEQSGLVVSATERTLEERHRELERELAATQERILRLAEQHGTDNLDELHEARVAQLAKLEGIITDLNLRIADLESRSAQGNADSEASGALAVVTAAQSPEQLAASDAVLAKLLGERMTLESQIESLKTKFTPEHRTMQDLARRLAAANSEIERRASWLLQAVETGGSVVTVGATRDQLLVLRDRYQKLRDDTSAAALQLGRARLSIGSLKDQVADIKRRLMETSQRLEAIRVENQNIAAGRVSIAARGDLPVAPASDKRIPLAVAGGMGGMGLGVGVIFAIGFVRRSFRFIDDVERVGSAIPLLGTLPDLKTGDAQRDDLAALSVHHLRNMLLLRAPTPRGRGLVFVVTSASAGDGKTSLTAALGMSFAVAGHRTLLVDADLVGRGLSRQLGMNRAPGLCEAILRGDAEHEITETGITSLWALPAGKSDGLRPEALSHLALRRIVNAVSARFDVVLIDSGPILGSLEANLVSTLADRVVVTVSRGQSAALVQAAVERLARIGAVCAGMVFNRANPIDMRRSISHVSMHGESMRSLAPGPAAPRQPSRPGELLRAVRARLPGRGTDEAAA